MSTTTDADPKPPAIGPGQPPNHEAAMDQDRSHVNPTAQVMFRAGLIACREYMARFVESENPAIAASIRANWWPELGPDFGPPRQLDWSELTEGEYDTPSFRVKGAGELSPTQEALAEAWAFLNLKATTETS